MDWKKEWKILFVFAFLFLAFFYLPVGTNRFDNAVLEAFYLVRWYVREHVVFCLIPAFLISGAISVFLSQESVLKYLGSKANKVLSYGVASISGGILAVCSCTVLPLFAGIHRRGAGLGPAITFLYSGPAINILAIILTARVLGLEIGVARTLFAICFSIVIGLVMSFIFRKEEAEKLNSQFDLLEPKAKRRPFQDVIYFLLMICILVFANWSKPQNELSIWNFIFSVKWMLTFVFGIGLLLVLLFWFDANWRKVVVAICLLLVFGIFFNDNPMLVFAAGVVGLSFSISAEDGELGEWFRSSWDFAKQILPLLFWGVMIAGFSLGRAGHEGIIPSEWISTLVGGNSLLANLFASVVGAFMYFATLTEVPIVQGLLGSGMGKGPALALLLSGPALSLPSMLVIRSVIGTKKTIVYVLLVIFFSSLIGFVFGQFYS